MSAPEFSARPEYLAAFRALLERIARPLADVPSAALPIRMYVAGGAALHFYTGERVSVDVDAAFSRRIALPEKLEVAYRDVDGTARLLYLDRQYSDTLGLMHADAHEESVALPVPGIDPQVLDVRLLTPLDLAVSKLGRYSAQDREDILALARRGLVDADALTARAADALGGYVGDLKRVEGAIADAAARIRGQR